MNLLNSKSNSATKKSFSVANLKSKFQQIWHVSLYSNAIYLVVSNAISSLIGFIFWIIAARLYTTEQVGLASAVIGAVGLVTSVSHLGMSMGLVRFLPDDEKQANDVINTFTTIGLITTGLTALIFIGGLSIWSSALLFLRQDLIHFIDFIALCLGNQLLTVTQYVFIAKRRSGYVTLQTSIFNVLRLLLVVVFAYSLHSDGIIYAWTISLILVPLICIAVLLPRVQSHYRPSFKIDKKIVSRVLSFSLANYIAMTFSVLPGTIFPLMVVNLLGADSNAYFYIAWTIGTILPGIAGGVTTSLFAEGSKDEKTLETNIWRSLKMSFIIVVPLTVLVMFIAPILLRLYGHSYADNGMSVLRLVVLASVPTILNAIYVSIKRVEKNMKALVIFSCVQGIASVLLALLLIKLLGLNGLGIAWLSVQTALALFVVIRAPQLAHLIKKLRQLSSHEKPSG